MTIHRINTAAKPNAWESPSLIPVLLMIIKEHLTQRENPHQPTSKNWTQRTTQYRALCQHWKQMTLNERQHQWLQEIEHCLQDHRSHASP